MNIDDYEKSLDAITCRLTDVTVQAAEEAIQNGVGWVRFRFSEGRLSVDNIPRHLVVQLQEPIGSH